MGAVYRATQLSLHRDVALKLLAPNLSDDAGFRARFEREGQVQAGLDHPHIVPVYEAGQSEYGLFLAMRLISGPTLKRLILDGSLDPRRTVRLLAQVANALDVAHQAGLIHRDIKPQNILIGKGDHAFLADFGLIKAPDEAALTGTGQFIGTIDYVAPEQIQAEPATPASDIYALAGVLYECLAGEVPFPKPSEAATLHAHVMNPPPKLSERRPDLPPALDGVIAQGMAKDPWSRPSRAAELVQAASRALSSSAPSTAAPLAAAARDGTAEPEQRAPTTRVPSAASLGSDSAQSGTASSSSPRARARADITRPVSRPHIDPPERDVTPPSVPIPAPDWDAAERDVTPPSVPIPAPDRDAAGPPAADEPAGEASRAAAEAAPIAVRPPVAEWPGRLVALIAVLTITAFAAGFVLGLIVH